MMTNSELIRRLKNDLQLMISWASELDSHLNRDGAYLDSDPDVRAQFNEDMERVRDTVLMPETE